MELIFINEFIYCVEIEIVKDIFNEVFKIKFNNRIVKNVIIFIGDGMGLFIINVVRIYKG